MPTDPRPPPQPAYVLRGHAAQIHAVQFSPSNSHLLTGDADGYIVSWSLTSKRPVASWKAHESAVLGLAWLGKELVISHGRDSRLLIWHLVSDGERKLSTLLPIEQKNNPALPEQQEPHILHELTVNTLNFCSFTWCWNNDEVDGANEDNGIKVLFIALPHTLSSEAIDIYELSIASFLLAASKPDLRAISPEAPTPQVQTIMSRRLSTIPAPTLENPKTGLTMCLALPSPKLLIAGYEGGQTLAYTLSSSNSSKRRPRASPLASAQQQEASSESSATHAADHAPWTYSTIYLSRPHTQPILSLAVDPSAGFFVTTSADAQLARHRIPRVASTPIEAINVREEQPESILNTKHSGQQGICFRDDGVLFATAGWDGRGRVYRAGNLSKVVGDSTNEGVEDELGNLNSGNPSVGAKVKAKVETKGKSKSMKELAVLKWHKEGCYSMGFAHILRQSMSPNREPSKLDNSSLLIGAAPSTSSAFRDESENQSGPSGEESLVGESEVALQRSSPPTDIAILSSALANVKKDGTISNGSLSYAQRREDKARNTHWLAMGSKDGRVSLWDIF